MQIFHHTFPQRSEDLAVSNVAFKIDDTVKELSGQVDKMLPSNKELIYNIKRDLIDTITNRTTQTVETQTRRKLTKNMGQFISKQLHATLM